MKLSTFLTLNAIMFVPFGIGMLLMPSVIFPMIGVLLDPDGLVMASTVGSMLLSFGLICFFSREATLDSQSMQAILIGNFTFHAIDSALTFKGAFTEVMNSVGFMFSGIHFIFAVGFLLFYLKSRKGL